MKSRSRSRIGLVTIAALVFAGAMTAGCSRGASADPVGTRANGDADKANYAADRPGIDRPFVDRAMIDPKEFGHTTPAGLGNRLGVDLKLPSKAAGGEFQGIYEPSEQDSFAAIYSNDVVIYIRRLQDNADAADWINHNRRYGDIAPHVTKWDLSGIEAYAIPKLDIAPAPSSETTVVDGLTWTKVQPGTGIRTGMAEVLWRRGRFVIEVMNPDQSIESLKGIARSMTFEPRESSTP